MHQELVCSHLRGLHIVHASTIVINLIFSSRASMVPYGTCDFPTTEYGTQLDSTSIDIIWTNRSILMYNLFDLRLSYHADYYCYDGIPEDNVDLC
jgi:hypothetical protein